MPKFGATLGVSRSLFFAGCLLALISPAVTWPASIAPIGHEIEHSNLPTVSDGEWQLVSIGVPNALRAADFLSPGEGWGVGLRGEIAHWDGNTWIGSDSHITAPTLNAVKLLDAQNGWAVGNNGTILSWDGEAWSLYPSPTKLHLMALSFVSPELGWAVGGASTEESQFGEQPIVLQWDGQGWHEIPGPARTEIQWAYTSVVAISADDIWLASRGAIHHWDGGAWTTFEFYPATGRIFSRIALDALDAHHAWAVAEELDTTGTVIAGVIFRWDGSSWTLASATRYGLYDIAMVRPDFGWAVGGNYENSFGGSVVLHWDGNAWTEVATPTNLPMNAVWASAIDDGWILAGGDGSDTGRTDGVALRYRPEVVATATMLPTPSPFAVPSLTPALTAPARVSATAPPKTAPASATATPTHEQASQPTGFVSDRYILLSKVIVILAVAITIMMVARRRKSRR
ncbi:MAG: hypothetical protein ABI847_03335 [Anaerolineales bacterium]